MKIRDLANEDGWHGDCFVPEVIAQNTNPRDTLMNTQISSKLAALALALMMNSIIVAAVAYLFDAQIPQHSTVMSLESATMHEVV
jgi:hypothetical protein